MKAPPMRAALLLRSNLLHGTVTVVVFEGELSIPAESTLVT